MNNSPQNKVIQAKIKAQMDKLASLPVVICSRGNIAWQPVEIFKRESSITSASGTEEFTPMATHKCDQCQKLIPYAKQIGSIPDILISDCQMCMTDDPSLIDILRNYIDADNRAQYGKLNLFNKSLHKFFTKEK